MISRFIVSIKSLQFLPEMNKLESSANNNANIFVETCARSFMYNKNRSGPNIEPWGTPHVIRCLLDCTSLNSTYCSISEKNNF